MLNRNLHKTLTICISLIWFANGLLCKVLNLVPRHEQIIGEILGATHSRLLTLLIGLSEIGMGIWILSGFKSRFNAIVQIIIIATMNTLEFIMVPDLLLWNQLNALFAFFLIFIIYFNEFQLNKKIKH